MTLSLEALKKLERIRELMAIRADAERELEELLGNDGPKPLTVQPKPNGGKGRPTSVRHCGKCGEVGHQARKCPKSQGGGQGKKKRKCGQCGELGHSKWKCPQTESKGFTPSSAAKEPLTESQFDDVKTAKENGLDARDIAENIGVELFEVNKAYIAHDYHGYLIIRKRKED